MNDQVLHRFTQPHATDLSLDAALFVSRLEESIAVFLERTDMRRDDLALMLSRRTQFCVLKHVFEQQGKDTQRASGARLTTLNGMPVFTKDDLGIGESMVTTRKVATEFFGAKPNGGTPA